MMKYIVISEDVKGRLMNLLNEFSEHLSKNASGITPVMIQSGEYILPLDVLTDPVYTPILERIKSDGNESLITIREVSNDEFIVSEEP